MNRQRGIALVFVLWTLVLLAIIAGNFAVGERTGATMAFNASENARAAALADAGVNRAVLAMLDPQTDQRWRADGTVYDMPVDGAAVRIAIFDELGKVDLNRAAQATIRQVFESAGLEADDADALADAVIDFRDPDNLTSLNGAEDPAYGAAGMPYGAKDAPFEAVDELARVFGMTAEIYDRVAPLFTVYSGQRGINPMTAAATLLHALPGVDATTVDTFLDSRSDTSVSLRPQMLPSSPAMPFIRGSAFSRVATIRAEARTEGGAVFVREAIIRVTGGAARPYAVLDWRRGKRSAEPEGDGDAMASEAQ